MQDVHPIGTTAGKALVDRRHHHHTAATGLKCPRCESTNTKFCYYNNYNLSQPRHFCKNCRRYWTNGGVLRNVPVGGGSRKSTKRSKPKPKISAAEDSTTSTGGGDGEGNDVVLEQSGSTDAKRVERVLVTPDIGGVVTVRSDSEPGPNSNSNLNPDPFGFGELLPTEEWEISGAQQEDKIRGLAGGIDVDPTDRIEYLLQSSRTDGGVVALDWQGNDQHGLGFFDDQSYWIQGTTSFDDHHLQQQWPDNHSDATNNDNLPLFLP